MSPLPATGTPWPPVEYEQVTVALRQWSAWYEGDVDGLEAAYRSMYRYGQPMTRPSTYRGGVVGSVARFFWGAPRTDLTQPRAKMHVPVAAEICQASADLLFSDPPTIETGHEPTDKRLEQIIGDSLHTSLAESGEVGAALGGVYLRVTWDTTISDTPFLVPVHADTALPTFTWDRLTAVTFWWVVREEQNTDAVWRHVERHELDSQGVGIIYHGLYRGTSENLGSREPLATLPVTAALAAIPDADVIDQNTVAITTGSPGLAVVYVPNQRPQRRWRQHPIGTHLGRSDLDGIEHLMDGLDETYSSWMRDIRLGKARVFVAQSMLENLGPGRGSVFDTDREVFSPLNSLGGRDSSLGDQLSPQQFQIRYEEHSATAKTLLAEILRCAGYSMQSFGEQDDRPYSRATATEVEAREKRSLLTRDRKIRLWRPAIDDVIAKLLAVDKVVFGSQVDPSQPVSVLFPDGVQDTPNDLATTASLLRTAEAASTKTLVEMVHPDWPEEDVTAEVDLIASETTAPAPPMTPPDQMPPGDQAAT